VRNAQEYSPFSAKIRYPAGPIASIGPAPRSLVELNLKKGEIRQSLVEAETEVLDNELGERCEKPMTPLEQNKRVVLQQTLKDYGLLD